MESRRYRSIHRLTPRVLLVRLGGTARTAWGVLLKLLLRVPPAGWLIRRLFLVEEVSLRDVAGDPRHGVSALMLEGDQSPMHFPAGKFESIIAHSGDYLDGDPYHLKGFPHCDPAAQFYGGLLAVQDPEPGMLYVPPRRYRCTLREPYLSLEHGGLATAAGTLVTDSAARRRSGRLTASWLFGRPRPRRARPMPGNYATIWGKWAGTNYYHWLIECLPRLRQIADANGAPPPTLLLPRSMPQVCEDSLACCLPAGLPVKRVDGWVRPERLLFTSFDHIKPVSWLGAEQRKFVRSGVFAKYGLDDRMPGSRRIFLSRSSAPLRRLVNEDEVRGILDEHGFESVAAEGLSFEQQARLFHGASHVVSTHGAGLANLLFAGPVKVLEIFAGGSFTPLYFFLAASLGQEHRFLVGDEPDWLEDFRLDPDKLRTALAEMLDSS